MTAVHRQTVQTEILASDAKLEACQNVDACSIAIIGAGPVGMRVAEEVLKRIPNASVTLFGNEPAQPYNRVQLSALLAGEIKREEIFIDLPSVKTGQKFQYEVATIRAIDTNEKLLIDNQGRYFYYQKLILAVGAKAFIPNIQGKDLQGVYSFRHLNDTESLFTRVCRSRSVVVMGGGLLGLEAAKGLLRFGTKVTLIQQGEYLMNRQLDKKAGELLAAKVKKLGIELILNEGVREIVGKLRVEAVRTRSGKLIQCDTVLMCTGISPNINLARTSGIRVAKGIVVNDAMQTSNPNVYAVGECVEHQGKTYGLVQPGYEQALVAAKNIRGEVSAYKGSALSSQLKVVNEQVSSLGEVSNLIQSPKQIEYVWQDKVEGIYRKVIVKKGKLIGAVSIGEWADYPRLQQLYADGQRIHSWQLWRFKLTGKLWADADARHWPGETTVCSCQGICKSSIDKHIKQGITELDALSQASGAGQVCGSCKPVLSLLLGSKAEKEKAWPIIFSLSFFSLLVVALLLVVPATQVADSVLSVPWHEKIWNDKFMKQVTGFSLLGFTAVGLLMSLRKRLNWTWMGQFSTWRFTHLVLGLFCVAGLMLHTGFHFGENLNRWLMLNFLAVTSLGGLAGFAIALTHKLNPSKVKKIRKGLSFIHILVAWPLPLLLIFHIISVYYF